VNIYIPFVINGQIHENVLNGIKEQSIFVNPVIISSYGTKNKREGELFNRNLILKICKEDEFCFMIDSDTVMIDPNNIRDMLNIMVKHPDINLVSLRHNGVKNHKFHFDLACCVFRPKKIITNELKQKKDHKCICFTFQDALKDGECCYLDDKIRIKKEDNLRK